LFVVADLPAYDYMCIALVVVLMMSLKCDAF